MALQVIMSADNQVALGSNSATGEHGFLFRATNRTGHTSVKGEVVGPSAAADGEVVLEDSGFDPFGVIAEAGIAEGSAVWCWGIGSVCQVLMKDATAAVRGYVGLADDVDGRAHVVAVPSSNPVQAEHFREIGHCIQSVSGGTNVLALFVLHFN